MAHGHFVGHFDILGFEKRLARFGLTEMLTRYEALIDVVDYRKEQIQKVFGDFGYKEAPYWTSEGDVSIFTEVYGAYASDSILLWSNRTWPEAREVNTDEYQSLANDPAEGWKYQPTPCDNFLDVCNDLMCRGLEVGLPLRGAIAIGDAILNPERNIFLGQPIVDAARLENGQKMISTSFCKSAMHQSIPARFTLGFDHHIKSNHRDLWGGALLDWPRHWRNTRKIDLVHTIQALNIEKEYSAYYENTLELIAHSLEFSGKFESLEETSIRASYKPFLWSNTALSIRARPVRRIQIEPNAKEKNR